MKFLHRILAAFAISGAAAGAPPELEAIDQVWSGHSVNFAIEVTRKQIVVAYYDAQRRLTVASRDRLGGAWKYRKLESVTGWDSHNYLAMAVDHVGQLHLIGNMHNDPLNYFRTTVADDIETFERVPVLVNPGLEQRMTYPVFMRDREWRLILKYRDGGSGNGNEIFAVYSPSTARWSHLLDSPLIDGEGKRNAYVVGPTVGPASYFHIAWVWRDTPEAETNHDLSYARSRDLVHWERSDGKPLDLPITLAEAEIVDAVPSGGGMINNNTVVGFDNESRPVITYHKFDMQGNTQVYLARREKANWRIVQLSHWKDFRWDFRGRGSLDSRLTVKGAVPASPDLIAVDVVRDGRPITFLLKSRSLKVVSEEPTVTLSEELREYIKVPEGMQLNTMSDAESSHLVIAWPTLPPNRDQPRDPIPAPTTLWLATLQDDGEGLLD